MDHALDDLRQRGFSAITLWVLYTNDRARGFYKAMGWTADGASKVDARPGLKLHEVWYRLDL
jgi:ribosomal protein S18 acetylase RimI-like enzyme